MRSRWITVTRACVREGQQLLHDPLVVTAAGEQQSCVIVKTRSSILESVVDLDAALLALSCELRTSFWAMVQSPTTYHEAVIGLQQ